MRRFDKADLSLLALDSKLRNMVRRLLESESERPSQETVTDQNSRSLKADKNQNYEDDMARKMRPAFLHLQFSQCQAESCENTDERNQAPSVFIEWEPAGGGSIARRCFTVWNQSRS